MRSKGCRRAICAGPCWMPRAGWEDIPGAKHQLSTAEPGKWRESRACQKCPRASVPLEDSGGLDCGLLGRALLVQLAQPLLLGTTHCLCTEPCQEMPSEVCQGPQFHFPLSRQG